jgi:hypothetical protein
LILGIDFWILILLFSLCFAGSSLTTTVEVLVQYVRREIRDLSEQEWNLWVDAMWQLKTMTKVELQNKYGPLCIPYDALVARHFAVSALFNRNVLFGISYFFPSFPSPFFSIPFRLLVT